MSVSSRLPARVDIRRLLQLIRPHRGTLAAALLALMVGTGMSLIYPGLIGKLVDGGLAGGDTSRLNHILLLLLLVFAIDSVFTFTRAYLFTVTGERVVAELRSRLYDAIVIQEIAFFDERRTGELTNRLASDTSVLQNTVTTNISMALRFGLQAVGCIGILIYTSPRLTGVMLAVVPVVVLVGVIYGRQVRKLSTKVQDALARANEVAEETFAGIRTVRSFARESSERERYAAAVDGSLDLAIQRTRASSMFGAAISFAGYAAIVLVIWYGGLLVVNHEITIGTLMSFLIYTLLIAVSLGALSSLYADFMKAIGASERVFELIDRVPSIAAPEKPAHLAHPRGEVAFHDVTFAYPSRPERDVLSDFEMTLAPGEVVALVGQSGSGKSTVAALIPRFYDPQRGWITFDGIDLRELDPDWLRAQIGVVSQEPILFAMSIAENIRYGRPGATEAEIEAAARAANAHEFVLGFPEGYQTLVGERGVRLSGGQKQRIAIARALLKDPKVLILDEATSALDAESEYLVQEALDRLMQGRTTLVIAHRLSTVKDADRVVVMEGGKIIQVGRHEALMAVPGLYRRLVERQFVDVSMAGEG
jgi:ATP-binding cassette subfamily B protein